MRKRLQIVLERAECKKVRFHDLRHTFATTALEHGMGAKTVSTIIGHVSISTTLNIYAHVTDEMRRTAAIKIDQSIGKADSGRAKTDVVPRKPAPSTFRPYKGQRRKPGAGSSHRSTTSCGRDTIHLSGPTEKDTHVSSTPTVWMSVNGCWRR